MTPCATCGRILLLRNDTFNQLPALGPLQDATLEQIFRGTSERPLQFVAAVVEGDLPLTELVTADWMVTDAVTATIYGVPYDFDAGGWQVSAWPDDRPRAGLLSSAQVWRRWESDGSNFNRGPAWWRRGCSARTSRRATSSWPAASTSPTSSRWPTPCATTRAA
ncbi:MAG: hypothetical protein R3F59_06665 [Myxococcota bacterium]